MPLDVQGLYSGKVSLLVFDGLTPVKETRTMFLTIGSNTCSYYLVDSEGVRGSLNNGECGSVGKYLFFKSNVSDGNSSGGRLQLKGKTGKLSASEPITFVTGGWHGLVEGTCKLKRIAD